MLGVRSAFAAALLIAAAPLQAAPPPQSIDGTWDLFWQTKSGPRQSGFMVFRQDGAKVTVELHGKGMVKAKGTLAGNAFRLSGTRMLVRYHVVGTWQADRMQGSFKVLNVDKPFTGQRRQRAS